MRKIAIYGKGGIGKSTTTSNFSVSLSLKGYKVMQIGCDPKSDSTKNLMGGKIIPSVLEIYKPDIVIYDVLGDVVCGGLAMPIRDGYAKFSGIIFNSKNIENELETVEKACTEMETEIVKQIPRSSDIQTAENLGGTVFEFTKDSEMVDVYNSLADEVILRTTDV